MLLPGRGKFPSSLSLFRPPLSVVFDFRSQEVSQLPEDEAYEFRLMAGQTIRLEPDGSVYLDDKKCSRDSFVGVDSC